MSLDKIDYKILHELDYDSRLPFSKLGKKVGLSSQTTRNRFNELVRQGVILRCMVVVDFHKIGYYSYRFYCRLNSIPENVRNEFNSYFSTHQNVLWLASTTGRWDAEIIFMARNIMHLNKIVLDIKSRFGRYIKNYLVSPAIVNYHFKRDYLIQGKRNHTKTPFYGFESPIETLSPDEVKILTLLSRNARTSNQEIARVLGVSPNTVKNHIKSLERRGVIQGFRIWIKLSKIKKKFYKSLIVVENFTEESEKKVLSFCLSNPNIVYLVENLGEWELEIESEVTDEDQFREIMISFKNQFPSLLREYEILYVHEELVMDYFPMGEELLARSAR